MVIYYINHLHFDCHRWMTRKRSSLVHYCCMRPMCWSLVVIDRWPMVGLAGFMANLWLGSLQWKSLFKGWTIFLPAFADAFIYFSRVQDGKHRIVLSLDSICRLHQYSDAEDVDCNHALPREFILISNTLFETLATASQIKEIVLNSKLQGLLYPQAIQYDESIKAIAGRLICLTPTVMRREMDKLFVQISQDWYP